MKVGDLVTVHPACVGFYVIIEKLIGCYYDGHQMWRLGGNSVQGPESPLDMSEKWMEVISESR